MESSEQENFSGGSKMCSDMHSLYITSYIILNSVRQHNHFIIQGNYKATCFDYRLVILRPILSIVSQDAMHILGSHRVYIHGIHQIKSFVSKGVTCKLY